jgi:hypothetical protein
MAFEDCISRIRTQAPDLTDDEIDEIVSELQRTLDARKAEAKLDSLDRDLLNRADELAQEKVEAEKIRRRNHLLNIKRDAELMQTVSEADQAVGDPSLGIEARTVGVNAPFARSRQSVDARADALLRQYLGGMAADLREQDVFTQYNANALERELAIELEQITLPDGQPGKSGSQDAVKLARIVDKYRKQAIARENRAGAWIKPLPGYITRNTHDMTAMRREGFEAWRDHILPLLDRKTTFKGVDDEEAFLRSAYDALVTGKHLKHEGEAETDNFFAFKGPGNLAKKVSAHRKLHWKDADAWLEYNRRFGSDNLRDSIFKEMARHAQNTALMETFGPNPRAMFDRIVDQAKTQYRDQVDKFDRLSRRALVNQFETIDGTVGIPGNAGLARAGRNVRAAQTLSKLGGATLSAITDPAFMAGEVRFQRGGNVLGSMQQSLRNVAAGFNTTAEAQRFYDLVGAGMDGWLGEIQSRFSAEDQFSGGMAQLMQTFFKLNLLGPWTDIQKRGMSWMMTLDLANDAATDWAGLPDQKRRLLTSFGFDAERWEIARQAVRTAPHDGRQHLMPDAVREVPDSAFGNRSARQIAGMRDEIETALRQYMVDRTDFATPTPGAREQAILNQGTQAGTPAGEALKFVTQFKSFPTTALTKNVGRDLFAGGARSYREALLQGKGDLLGLATMIAHTTVLGGIAMTAKDLTDGKEPRDPTDPATYGAAALQGGGLGIFGDFLLGESNRYGISLLGTLAGPTLGQIDSVDELRAKIMYEGLGESVPGAVRLAINNTPFANLFYTQAAMDYLIFYQLQEMSNPGYLERMESSLRNDQNQRFFIPPSDTIPRGGGDDLFEGVR